MIRVLDFDPALPLFCLRVIQSNERCLIVICELGTVAWSYFAGSVIFF